MSDRIDYGNLMHNAMRSLIRTVLDEVAERGLPGAHHFFISFDTTHPEVELADWLRERFPEDMTIVMQHWFADLDVGEDGFAVTLNFGDQPERMAIPYDAIRTFVDPSVEFGLRFETQEDEEEAELAASEEAPVDFEEFAPPAEDSPAAAEEDKEDAHKDAEIVSLDSFRK
ncbi:ClpXP protease specificity-enhancing factor SspB [Aliiroseovarius sp.]|uniref:SspB family protein n=1 Tax=Aliiroseovarius sp. TaxID=1872442 RepID=UPI002620BEAB|nr:ClpXP protease specificity-enhancing factor SspB [Aliiroseovarius sp.]